MKGKLYNTEDGWMVDYLVKEEVSNGIKVSCDTLQLHHEDVNEILELSEIFDNIEARINADPEVEFEIFENKKLDGVSRSAKLTKKTWKQS